MIDAVLAKLLNSDDATDIKAGLADYNGGKAIFSVALPDDCAFPAILITQDGGQDWGCRENEGGVIVASVQIFDDKSFTKKEVRALAGKIWRLINRHDLEPWITEAGYENWGCFADPPLNTNDGLGFPGYTIRVNVRVLRAA